MPQVRDRLGPFESVWLRTIGGRSKGLVEAIFIVYVRRMSQRDIKGALDDDVS